MIGTKKDKVVSENMTQMINEIKNCFTEKINKNDKPLTHQF